MLVAHCLADAKWDAAQTQRERRAMSKPIPGFWPEQSLCQKAYKDETGEWKRIGSVLIMLDFQSLWTVLLGAGMTNRLLVKGQA